MKEFLETKTGKVLLFVVVIGIWSINFFNFSEVLNPTNEQVNRSIREISLDDVALPASSTYVYKPSSRDPFSSNKKNAPIQVEKDVIEDQEIVFKKPQLSLTGIIGNIAVITDEKGESYFVSKGDSLISSYIIDVTRESVILSNRDKKFVITLSSKQ